MSESHSVVVLPRWEFLDRLMRKLEGRRPWGYFETAVLGRGTWMRERLVLFPPGTTAAERRALAVYRHWPVAGACLAIVLTILLGGVLSPALGFFGAFLVYGLIIWLSSNVTRQVRHESVQLATLTILANGNVLTYGNVDSMKAVRATLADLDARMDAGQLSRGAYEAERVALFCSLASQRDRLEGELRDGTIASDTRR
ncbi:MAG: DUF6611 family protein [Actinomycetota bacterium]